MLETMRQNSKSLIIWVVFGILIAAFIISFGPQAHDTGGCGASKQSAMEVGGTSVSLNSWRFAVNGLRIGSGGSGPEADRRRAMALDYLLERELLAQAAEERGMRVSDDIVNQAIAAGDLYMMGHRLDGRQAYFNGGVFDYAALERYAQSVGLPNIAALVGEQRREHLADLMRATLLSGGQISEEEARTVFIAQNSKISAETVMFDVARYQRAIELTDADVAAYAERHAEELKKAWEADKAELSIAKERVAMRAIFVAKKDTAKATIEAARKRIADGADFGTVAREVSEADSRYQGGRIGWRPTSTLGQGPEVTAALKTLEVGALSEIIEAEDGYHLVKLDGKSDKALTFEDARTDLAAEQAVGFYARELARRDAEAALARARSTPLDEMFEREMAPSKPGLPEGMTAADLGLPEGVEITTAPADGDGAAATGKPVEAPAKAPVEAPANAPAPAKAPAPADGKQGWIVSEGDIVLAQAGGEPAAAKPVEPPRPAADEKMPKVTVEPPQIKSVGPLARSGEFIAGVGRSEELVRDMFETMVVGEVAPKVYVVESPEGFALVKLTARTEADLAQFDKEKSDWVAAMTERKASRTLVGWLESRCKAVSLGGQVRIEPEVIRGDSDKPMAYQACRNINGMSVDQQLATRRRR